MGKCKSCGAFVLFGGKQAGGQRYCNAKCAAQDIVQGVAEQVPVELVNDRAKTIHAGPCPECRGPGPVDVHVSYRVISIVVASRWSSRLMTACRACGNKRRLGDAIYCFFLGWWGFPHGLVATPTNIVRNLWGMTHGPDPSLPSPLLIEVARGQLAAEAMAPDDESGPDAPVVDAAQSKRHLVAR